MSRLVRITLATLIAYVTLGALVTLYGESPREIVALLLEGTWGSAYGAGQVLFKATPILFAAVAVEVGLRAGIFNVGVEGQLAVGSLVAAWVGARVPGVIGLGLSLASAACAGAAWSMLAGILKVKRGVHEVISTIMLNRLSDSGIAWGLGAGLAVHGTVHTAQVGTTLPRISLWFSAFRGSALSVAALLALGTLAANEWFFARTVWGRELVSVGSGPRAARAAGIDVEHRWLLAFALSGALAGLGASATVLGYKGYFEQGLGAGAGFSGLAVAMMGRRDPVMVLFAALLFGTLEQGGLSVNAYVPKEIMMVVTAAVMVAISWFERRGEA